MVAKTYLMQRVFSIYCLIPKPGIEMKIGLCFRPVSNDLKSASGGNIVKTSFWFGILALVWQGAMVGQAMIQIRILQIHHN
jgi:hypothetical protein